MSLYWDTVPAGTLRVGDNIRMGRVIGVWPDGDQVMVAWRGRWSTNTDSAVWPASLSLETKRHALDAAALLRRKEEER